MRTHKFQIGNIVEIWGGDEDVFQDNNERLGKRTGILTTIIGTKENRNMPQYRLDISTEDSEKACKILNLTPDAEEVWGECYLRHADPRDIVRRRLKLSECSE